MFVGKMVETVDVEAVVVVSIGMSAHALRVSALTPQACCARTPPLLEAVLPWPVHGNSPAVKGK